MPIVMLFRADKPDGTQEDWAYEMPRYPFQLTIFSGRTGTTLGMASTWCSDPIKALQAQAALYQAQGYRPLGRHALAEDRRTLTPMELAPAPTRTPVPDFCDWFSSGADEPAVWFF